MLKLSMLSILLTVTGIVMAQFPPATAQVALVNTQLNTYRTTLNTAYSASPDMIVHEYTFRRMIQRDFSKIITGENSFSKVGRYATLDVNTDESKFYLTPITFIRSHDPLAGPFKNIHTIDISGEINGKGLFDFKNRKTIKAGYSWTLICDNYTAKAGVRNTAINQQIVDAVHQKILASYNSAQTNVLDFIEKKDGFTSLHDLQKDFAETLADYEDKFYDDAWDRKRIAWLKVNLIPISWDNFSYMDPDKTTSFSKPLDKTVFTPGARVSFNWLWTFNKSSQFYASGWLGGGVKHSLSEISDPVQWYQFKALTDSTFTIADDKKVYTLKEADFQTKFRPDIGAQLIYFFHVPHTIDIGVDVSTSFNGIVMPKSNAYIRKTSLGLVFPFLDKDGESSINIQAFVQLKSFINADMDNETFWGLKSGLPFQR